MVKRLKQCDQHDAKFELIIQKIDNLKETVTEKFATIDNRFDDQRENQKEIFEKLNSHSKSISVFKTSLRFMGIIGSAIFGVVFWIIQTLKKIQ